MSIKSHPQEAVSSTVLNVLPRPVLMSNIIPKNKKLSESATFVTTQFNQRERV